MCCCNFNLLTSIAIIKTSFSLSLPLISVRKVILFVKGWMLDHICISPLVLAIIRHNLIELISRLHDSLHNNHLFITVQLSMAPIFTSSCRQATPPWFSGECLLSIERFMTNVEHWKADHDSIKFFFCREFEMQALMSALLLFLVSWISLARIRFRFGIFFWCWHQLQTRLQFSIEKSEKKKSHLLQCKSIFEAELIGSGICVA